MSSLRGAHTDPFTLTLVYACPSEHCSAHVKIQRSDVRTFCYPPNSCSWYTAVWPCLRTLDSLTSKLLCVKTQGKTEQWLGTECWGQGMMTPRENCYDFFHNLWAVRKCRPPKFLFCEEVYVLKGCLAGQLEECVTLDLGVIGSSRTLGTEPTLK